MPKFIGGAPPFIGTQDNLTIYFMKGEYIVRTKSSLTGKRVKRDPAFAKTMMYAGWLKQGSRIASRIYKQLPDDIRVYKRYRELTGKAMSLLKEGFEVDNVIIMLEAVYLSQLLENIVDKNTDRHNDSSEYIGTNNSGNNSKYYSELSGKYAVGGSEYNSQHCSDPSGKYAGGRSGYNNLHYSELSGEYAGRESGYNGLHYSELSGKYAGGRSGYSGLHYIELSGKYTGGRSGYNSLYYSELSGGYTKKYSDLRVEYSREQTTLCIGKCNYNIACMFDSK